MRISVVFVLLLAMISHSNATYCLCKDGIDETELQKTLDYACGAGADCKPIIISGVCFQPNTVKAHCDWAANSYFQKLNQASAACNFSGTATPSPNPPTTVANGCVYPSSPSNTGTPPTGTGTGGTTPTIPTTPPSSTTTTTPGIFPNTPVFGPSSTPTQNDAVSASIRLTYLFFSFALSLFFLPQLCVLGQQ